MEQLVPRAGPEFETSIELMRISEQAHSEWTAQQRINKALNSRGNRQYQYHPGDLVYYWRKQVSGQKSTSAQQKQGCFLGPARILATETKREADGSLRPGSSVWVIRGRRLVKCCPEQLRPATQREELLEHITQDEQQQAPWTFSRLTQGLGGNEFEDITHELPDQQEWEEAQDSPMPPAGPPETPRHRVWGKRLGEGPERQLPDGTMYQPATRQRTGEPELADGLIAQECWYSKTTEHSRQEAHGTEFWQQPNTAIEIEIQNPDSKRQWSSFVNDFSGYFVGALKRRAIEVNEKKLSVEDQRKFAEAKQIEVKNYVAVKAFEALPPDLRPPPEVAIKMRWLLTWKRCDDGSSKAKARAILLGYQDPSYEERETTSPVMTRQTRQFVLTAAARFGW